jgi:hypothetical protein
MDHRLLESISDVLAQIPVIDIYSQIGNNGSRRARNLADLLFFPWLALDLKNAGCPEAICYACDTQSEDQAAKAMDRVRIAVRYIDAIANTANYNVFRSILLDLYGVDERLKESNMEKIAGIVLERCESLSWESEVLRAGNIVRIAVDCTTNLEPGNPFYFTYADAVPLYCVGLGSPEELRRISGKNLNSIAELASVLGEEMRRLIAEHSIRALRVTIPSSWRYTGMEGMDMDRLLTAWMSDQNLSTYEQNCLASFSADVMARLAAERNITVQFFCGSTSYGKNVNIATWHVDFLRSLMIHVGRHPNTMFDLLLATRNASHEAASMARAHTNLMVSGAWWHAFTPSTLTVFYRDRLEMLPMTRWNAFHSDATCVEWCYGNLVMARNRLALALTSMVEERLIDETDVLPIARAVLNENPRREYSIFDVSQSREDTKRIPDGRV